MRGDKWWGYLHTNGVVTITQSDPRLLLRQFSTQNVAIKVVGPFEEDLADDLEGDQKMVRRRIIAALYDKPLEDVTDGP